ncbi:patatin-like phospholipase family protein [Candidatus Berkiella cookevillensis]|uniref:NTE family protein RssA n=1 Tax=Candidatus Berkiella cookevillensis TaxID=437022 RepID=A0A0Q9YEM8_9GAMM|nr:patatin-like phospholipase family protein [Candidatus Berkiella cookevillensis]MCS5709309.1 patatin-like phospholipase family protein [Candidatus Berkiella cookevillensis]
MKLITLFLSIVLSTCAFAQTTDTRPKIGLVLSGGGAKGGAHIGVLKKIDEMQIPIDVIVGTSMGAVVGGLYAVGNSAIEIEKILSSVAWDSILINKIDRDYLYYRRKRDDDLFLIRQLIGLKNGSIRFPQGVVQGHKLYQAFKKETIVHEPLKDFDALPIPFRAVATDLISGKCVVLSQGDLANAMYASMAVPGLFSPAMIDGQLLVDGGVTNNLPVEIAKEMGVDIIIAVDVGAPMLSKNQIEGFDSVLDQLTNIYTQENMQHSLHLLSEKDILISPIMKEVGTSSYDQLAKAIQYGEEATEQVQDKLAHLAYGLNHTNHNRTHLYIKGVHIQNETVLNTKTYQAYLPICPGYYTPAELDDYISRLYGLELFEKIEYNVDNNILMVTPNERSWGPTYIQGSLLLGTDFEGNSNFRVGLGITKTLMNAYAGEGRLFGSIGEVNGILSDIYQPFTRDLVWYINPRVGYIQQPFHLYIDDEAFAQYLLSTMRAELGIGRNLYEWGRVEIGYGRANSSARLKVGNGFPDGNQDDGFVYSRFEWDTLDNSFFPHEGTVGAAQYYWYKKDLGGNTDFEQFQIQGALAQSVGKHSGAIVTKYQTTTAGEASFDAQFTLGGLFRLSGLAEQQLFGQHAALLTFLYYYSLKDVSIIPNYPFPLYLGMSLETGNTWQSRSSIREHSFRKAGSLFLGFDTIIGPFYFGYGFAENGKRALHLFMGRPF